MKFDEINSSKDIIITIPKNINWETYVKEIDLVSDNDYIMRFKVPFFPKETKVGNRCYIVHNGFIRGWMEIVGFTEGAFTCSTTGKKWNGKFIERSGKFYKINPEPFKGFQGWRYYNN